MNDPRWLQPGDLLRVITPSGCLREFEAFEKGLDVWRSRGYRVEPVPGFDDRWGYLAGKDSDRLRQLTDALQDPDCQGILCARGGYGSTRVLELGPGSDSPSPLQKWLIGFSDITGLLWSYQSLQIWGVHGPVLTTLAAEPDWSLNRLFDCVEGRSLQPLSGQGWGGGQVSGRLLPANLTVATHLLGTSYQPLLTDVILAFEDVSEAPYRIDRMLTQWRMTGAFRNVRGIALGRFSRCEPSPDIPSFTIDEVLRDRLGDLGIPVVSDLPFGHDGVNAALPVGIQAHLDGDRGILKCDWGLYLNSSSFQQPNRPVG